MKHIVIVLIMIFVLLFAFYCSTLADYIGSSTTFHDPNCRYSKIITNPITYNAYQDAIDAGLLPCKVCNPQPEPTEEPNSNTIPSQTTINNGNLTIYIQNTNAPVNVYIHADPNNGMYDVSFWQWPDMYGTGYKSGYSDGYNKSYPAYQENVKNKNMEIRFLKLNLLIKDWCQGKNMIDYGEMVANMK